MMESVAAMVMADSTSTIENHNLDGINDSLKVTDNNSHGGGDEATGADLQDLAAIKVASEARLREMENEVQILKQMTTEVNKLMSKGNLPGLTRPLNTPIKEKIEADNRSVYVGNVDYCATVEDIKEHFHGCGYINRVSILCNQFNGHPKGFAYIEFDDEDSVRTAMAMDESLFKGRLIKVMPKRTNKPGLATTNRQPRGMQGRGCSFRGSFSRYNSSFSSYNSGYRPMRSSRGYSRGNSYSPYIVRRGPAATAR